MSGGSKYKEDTLKVVDWMKTDPYYQKIWLKDPKGILASAYRLGAFYQAESGEWANAFKSYLKSFSLSPVYLIRDWRRFGFTLLNLLGLNGLTQWAKKQQTRKRQGNLQMEKIK
jgi:hypothetical protein